MQTAPANNCLSLKGTRNKPLVPFPQARRKPSIKRARACVPADETPIPRIARKTQPMLLASFRSAYCVQSRALQTGPHDPIFILREWSHYKASCVVKHGQRRLAPLGDSFLQLGKQNNNNKQGLRFAPVYTHISGDARPG